ncbi:MAG: hypothetical protein KKE23_01555 [Nanoarchaeota archaeon]|nr:hypothetical protein [Nanoarchaeota archaeon]
MRITVSEIQKNVDKFLPGIRRAGIAIEDIVVVKARFNHEEPEIFSEGGRIYVDPTKSYKNNSVSHELLALHELGHRAIEAINPSWNDILMKKAGFDKEDGTLMEIYHMIKAHSNGKLGAFYATHDGLTECFALDIFPEFCSISDFCKINIEKTKKNYEKITNKNKFLKFFEISYDSYKIRNIAKGFGFFHKIHSKLDLPESFDTIKEYVEEIKDYPLPTKQDFEDPMYYALVKGMKQNH